MRRYREALASYGVEINLHDCHRRVLKKDVTFTVRLIVFTNTFVLRRQYDVTCFVFVEHSWGSRDPQQDEEKKEGGDLVYQALHDLVHGGLRTLRLTFF